VFEQAAAAEEIFPATAKQMLSRPRLYIDEDAMDGDLVRGLRSRGIDMLTAAAAGMIRCKDAEHLSLATAQGRALQDFHEIHTESTSTGIVLAQQKPYSRPVVTNLPANDVVRPVGARRAGGHSRRDEIRNAHLPRCTQADSCATLTS
jgi:hypothetical protein